MDKKSYSCASRKMMSITDQLHLLELVIENPGIYLTEMKKELYARGTNVDESTICRFLKESKFSRKKMRLVAIQLSEELRARYLAEVVLYSPNMLVFVDERQQQKGCHEKVWLQPQGSALHCQKALGMRSACVCNNSTV